MIIMKGNSMHDFPAWYITKCSRHKASTCTWYMFHARPFVKIALS